MASIIKTIGSVNHVDQEVSYSKLLNFETYFKINCQDQLKQVDAGSERVNHVKVTFY